VPSSERRERLRRSQPTGWRGHIPAAPCATPQHACQVQSPCRRTTRGEAYITKWLVRLKGHAFDLEELSDRFTSADRNVTKDADGYYYLRSSDFDQVSNPDAVRERAFRHIELMNGATELHTGGSYRPVELDVVTRIDDSGNRHHHITLSATVEGRSRMTGKLIVGETGEIMDALRPPSGTEFLVNLASRDDRVADVLRFYERGDWVNLYKAWEVVCDAAGGTHEVVNKGWTDAANRRRFTGTAQSRAKLGDEARHASEKYRAPKDPMTSDEARDFVRSVIQAWLQTL
jgi:hypothetical protein